jgi:hypothetical protein
MVLEILITVWASAMLAFSIGFAVGRSFGISAERGEQAARRRQQMEAARKAWVQAPKSTHQGGKDAH